MLATYRFTNTYRAADRVSQYLIRNVQYRSDRSQAPAELFFRTLLFKIFNKIETWELIETQLGPVSWQSMDLSAVDALLDRAMTHGARIYSAAYIMPSPQLGHARKHANHLSLLARMMDDGLPARVERARNLAEVYELLSPYPGLGPFLTFQYAIDLNYSNLLDFSEADFVVAGPGALDGIAKCFEDTGGRSAREVIEHMAQVQDREFAKLGIDFKGLFGRKLQLIDCQNIFCEISKYARVAHPEVRGVSDRKRIKQSYRASLRAEPAPLFPPRWQLEVPSMDNGLTLKSSSRQGQLF
ncbi:hypothetical protein LRS12_06230 [Sphingomonas sp. J344]|uniref:nucleotide kinase domain-containing protein n=1 Tax=Sphingomonas sp. J344 TaxID=2898434 RepID=UPI002150F2F9|nr:nucleotide kinase domain-containing protein [Sphingomonas sp. J344]MCR5870355.1 hypothetical protein [Sphingomonas sp. J344]